MPSRTVEEKYNFLLQHLKVTDLDFWENDGLIKLEPSIYFQFRTDANYVSIDEAIEYAMGNHFVTKT